MRVLLTGATGLIGPCVLEHLLSRGDDVHVLALPETVLQVPRHDRVRVVAGSLAQNDRLGEATQGVEVVYHLGAMQLGSNPEDLIRVNVQGTGNLLRASVDNFVRRFVFISSVAAYGSAPWPYMWPITEDSLLGAHGGDDHRNYGQSKIDGENLVREFHRQHGLEYVIIRPPGVYGPEAEWVEELLEHIFDRPALAFARGARSIRMQWVHVRDLSEAIVLAGTRPEAANNVFNVPGDELITLRTLIAAVRQIVIRRSWMDSLGFQPRNRGDYGLKYDLSKAQKLLDYTPRVKLREGLEEIIAAKTDYPWPFPPFTRGPWRRPWLTPS